MRFDQIYLPDLPPPNIIEEIDYEELLKKKYLDPIVARADAQGIDLSRAIQLETSPSNIIAQVMAYAEMLIRERVNEAARAVMLPSATESDLDHLGSLFGTARMPLAEVLAPRPYITNPEDWEDDTRYRRRIQLALEAFSTAGPYGAYVYHTLKTSTRIKDAAVYGPESELCEPGEALNVVLSTDTDGTATQSLLNQVAFVLNGEEIRPLTDKVLVQSASITYYTVEGTIYVGRGPDPELVRSRAVEAIQKYTASRHMIGRIVAESGIKASAFSAGAIDRVVLTSPATDVDPGLAGAAYCDGIEISVETVDA